MKKEIGFSVILKAKTGDQKSYTLLFNHYKGLILFEVRKIISSQDAEDLQMEIFEKVFENLEKYRPIAKFSTWIIKITRNYCFDFLKKRQLEYTQIENIVLTCNENPESGIIHKENIKKIESELNKLNPRYRSIIKYYCFDEINYSEISKKLGITENNARALIFRAKSKLRKNLNE